jgi:hypothetical protein
MAIFLSVALLDLLRRPGDPDASPIGQDSWHLDSRFRLKLQLVQAPKPRAAWGYNFMTIAQ